MLSKMHFAVYFGRIYRSFAKRPYYLERSLKSQGMLRRKQASDNFIMIKCSQTVQSALKLCTKPDIRTSVNIFPKLNVNLNLTD